MKNPIYQRQLDLFELNRIKQADIVMLGNSLTNGANWNELLGRHSVVERGIVSDVLEGFSHRMRYVYELKPKIVFILGGLNDIYNWVPVEQIYADYIKIIEGLKARRIIPVIQSTLYAGRDWGKAWLEEKRPELNVVKYNEGRNSEVDRLNKMLYNYAKVHNIEYIDLLDKMSRGHFLKSELTYDGAHLNANGYKIWVRDIEKILKKNGL
jgi:lysophospholipase L1-like esterase